MYAREGSSSSFSSLPNLYSSDSLPASNGNLTELGASLLRGSPSTTPSSSQKLTSDSRNSSSSSLLRAHSRGSFSRLLLESGKCNGPADVLLSSSKHSLLYRIIQLVVFTFRLITPLSYAFLAAHLITPSDRLIAFFPGGLPTYMFFTAWMIAEALFFPYYFYLFRKLNYSYNDELKHLCTDRESRMKLVKMCFEGMSLSGPPQLRREEHIRKVMEGWFLDQPLMKIHFGNMSAWTAWAFFGKDVKTMTTEEVQENNDIVTYIEGAAQWKFPPGFNADIPPLRLNLDPIFVTQRPFLFYASIYLVTQATHLILHYIHGFSMLKKFSTAAQRIYYRKASKENKSGGLPIVFVHGIGAGFTHYLPIISQFPKDVDVFLVEWPYVAMQMATSAPTAEESVQSVVNTLNHFQHEKATFLAHSLGTVLVAWMLHDPVCARKVASTVLLDPIIFLLCDPTVASVFVYKDPVDSWDLLMHFFLSRELFISNALSRHFAWSYNILFVEELLNNKSCCSKFHPHLMLPTSSASSQKHALRLYSQNEDKGEQKNDAVHFPFVEEDWRKHHRKHRDIEHTIILATNDMIVPTACVSRYLTAKRKEGFNNFELIVFEGTHGEVTFLPKWISVVKKKLYDRSHLPSASTQAETEVATST